MRGDKELIEKLGRNDPCPCGSGHRFQTMLSAQRPVSMAWSGMTTTAERLGPQPYCGPTSITPTPPPATP
ncbi:SEC-C metal-binding domain-containing protein [Sphingomonas sp.]|uniref:SEC-C metal-binding domain-containing protein n=1 Tax=Sphingomonas sp. TaxID=28214 RepID=UPI003CC54644